jgi:hypothetical protein
MTHTSAWQDTKLILGHFLFGFHKVFLFCLVSFTMVVELKNVYMQFRMEAW